jgi:carbon starvation protein
MSALVLLIVGIVLFVVAYIVYGGFLSRKWGIDPNRKTPAHTMRDDIDYCPTRPAVLLGHHFSSIAGAGPITGPILAMVFGWLPVYLWITIGSIFFGGVHDFGSLLASIRHESKSIGEVIKANIGNRGKKLFNIFAWLTLILVVAAFTDICASTFAYITPAAGAVADMTGARAGTASIIFIFLAIAFGIAVYRRNAPLLISTIVGVALLFGAVWLGFAFPVLAFDKTTWIVILLVYIALASVLPVWFLLQPRDYLCSFLLYSMLGGGLVGILMTGPTIVTPAFTSFKVGGQFLFPFLFVTVACGAISGFHSLVSSGTTAKQINSEKDARTIGYGAMLIEGLVAIVALIAVISIGGLTGSPAMKFAVGLATFMNTFGLPMDVGKVFVILSYSAFALTSLDTATRIGRYIFQELFADLKNEALRKFLTDKYVATLITVAASIGLILYGYARIWPIFGSTNQLLAALALLAVSAWLAKSGKKNLMTIIPMIFMFCVTLTALALLGYGYWTAVDKAGAWAPNVILGIMAVVLFVLAVILIMEAVFAFRKKPSAAKA